MDSKDLNLFVLQYMSRKGYQTLDAVKSELKTELGGDSNAAQLLQQKVNDVHNGNSVLNFLLFHVTEDSSSTYKKSYCALREWIHQSLDLYRNELLPVLYPIFVHIYLDLIAKNLSREGEEFFQLYEREHTDLHAGDLVRLHSIKTAQQLQENEYARCIRMIKTPIRLCNYSLELFLSFLTEHRHVCLLSIINQYIELKLQSAVQDDVDDGDYRAASGVADDEINRTRVQWGLLEGDPMCSVLNVQPSDKDSKGPDGSQGSGQGEWKNVSLPTKPALQDRQELEDIRKMVRLSAQSLPSTCFYTFFNSENTMNCVDINRDCSMVAAGFSNSTIRVWNVEENHSKIFGIPDASREDGTEDFSSPKKRQKTSHEEDESPYDLFVGHSGPVFATRFSPDNKFLVSCSEDKTVRLWSMETKTNLVAYQGHGYPVWDVAWGSIGWYFATASHDRTARLWTTDRVHPLRIFAGHLSDVDTVKFHPNSNYIATGSSDKTVRLWDIQKGNCVRVFTGHNGPISALAFSPDGRLLASGGHDRKIMIWDIAEGRKLKSLYGHENKIWSLDFSREGNLLASGSHDHSVRLWNINQVRNGAVQKGISLPSKSTKPQKCPELLSSFFTKACPVIHVQFTWRNLLLGAGVHQPLPSSSS